MKKLLLILFAVEVCAATESMYNGMKYFGAPQDWISLRMEGFSAEELPCVYADGVRRKVFVRHEVPNLKGAHGPKGFPFINMGGGELTLKIRNWDGTGERIVGKQKVPQYWSYGQELAFVLDMKSVPSGAYVLTAEIPPHVTAANIFNPTNTGSGCIGLSMLYGRNAMRLAVFPNERPGEIFGVGNGMIHTEKWWLGSDIANTVEARDLAPVAVGDGDSYHNAIIGCPGCESMQIDALGPTNVVGINNPAAKLLDIFSPAGKQELKRRARETGERLGRSAGIAVLKTGNEAPQFNRGALCPTPAADASFREWCRLRFKGNLAALNRELKRNFASWDEIRQPIYIGTDAAATNKTGAAAVDWYANMGRVSDELVKYWRANENLEFAMEWYRWRTRASIMMYANFVKEAKRYDSKTLYGNNYCWPNFFAHLVLPTWRRMDVAMLDCQYICAFPRTLGSNSEMIEILEMTESAMRGKPIWGREIYVQPHYPEAMVALQNWAMVAHGMSVNLVFAWKPYSDHGNKVFKAGPRAWERPADAVPMWMLIDTDGTRLPAYNGVKRSSQEIAAFHKQYNALSLQRTPGRVAIYLSDETSMYTMLVTGDKPYQESRLCHTRDWLANELRLAGVRIEYFDDETLPQLNRRDFDILICPPMPRVTSNCAALIDAFAKQGGKVIRLEDKEPAFITDHPELPRSAWFKVAPGNDFARDVEVVVRTQKGTGKKFVFVLNRSAQSVSGSLAGSDFAPPTTLTDALTSSPAPTTLTLPPYGYRVLIKN